MSFFKSNSGKKSQINRKTDLESSKSRNLTIINPFRYKPMLLSDNGVRIGQKGWVWEVKEDGTRLMTTITKDNIWLVTTNGIEKFKVLPELKDLGKDLNFKERIVVDTEGVVLKNGISDYPSAERRFGRQKKLTSEEEEELTKIYPVTLMAFDILEVDGQDLTQLPLIERKKVLQNVLKGNENPHIKMVESYNTEDAMQLLKKSYDFKLEGIVGKKLDSKYNAKTELEGWVKKRGDFVKTPWWAKEKITSMMDAFVFGYTSGTGRRSNLIGSFLLASWDKEKEQWRYVGQVGTGFNDSDLIKLTEELSKLPKTKESFIGINSNKVRTKTGRNITLIDPQYYNKSKVMRIRFQEYTPDQIMRMPVYEGFRDDIGIKDTHLEFQKFPPKELEGLEKRDIASIDWNTYKQDD